MKQAIILTGFLYLVLVFACKKSNTDNSIVVPQDSIVVSDISKTIPSEQSIEVSTLYNYLLFYIAEDSLGIKGFYPIVTRQTNCLACDQGLQEILTDNTRQQALPLDKNTIIGSNGNWNEPLRFNLSNLAGKAELYIGFRSTPYIKTSNSAHNYGWIKIELSQNKSSIIIKSSAINMTPGNPIKAGQVK